eukprot:CAMPEP_0117686484 /NCGR_PEP_ID=MMETSP0804-20121206/22477_1 /TAXON_ID=1074897 /ORGANISM="Tetraselmis astigmatica, Strain CCMP880" /LENGTH=146 /DNA_ID=CAMNT_0005498185 /DNA_START=108 /DNA_END=544 /DNA_ORIENTATION=+
MILPDATPHEDTSAMAIFDYGSSSSTSLLLGAAAPRPSQQPETAVDPKEYSSAHMTVDNLASRAAAAEAETDPSEQQLSPPPQEFVLVHTLSIGSWVQPGRVARELLPPDVDFTPSPFLAGPTLPLQRPRQRAGGRWDAAGQGPPP